MHKEDRFEVLRKLDNLGDFSPEKYLAKYMNRGVPFDDLVEAIIDGAFDAYLRFDPTLGSFSEFAHWHVLGQITTRFRKRRQFRTMTLTDLEALNSFNVNSDEAKRARSLFGSGDVFNLVPDESTPLEVELDMDALTDAFGSCVDAIIDAVFPEQDGKTSEQRDKRNRKRDILKLRYVKGKEWGEIAEILGMSNKQAPQWHNKSAIEKIQEFVNSPEGEKMMIELLGEINPRLVEMFNERA